MSNTEAYQSVLHSAEKKIKLLGQAPFAYLIKAILAGVYLTLIGFLFWQLKENLHASPFGNVVASLFFGLGLYIIIITQAELFTSNVLYMTGARLQSLIRWPQILTLWGVAWLGNLMGALIMAGLLFLAGALEHLPPAHALFHGALHKVDQAWHVIFVKGILANWVVCLAVWVSLHLKEETAKFTAIVAIVSIFLYLAFEHSIANMGTFSLALMSPASTVTIGAMLYNLLFATLGNIVGGAVLVALPYGYCYQRETTT